jgi:hypothetical protein
MFEGSWSIASGEGVVTLTFPELGGWHFTAEAVSPGLYEVRGIDRRGRRIVRTGTRILQTVEACRQAAAMTQTMAAQGRASCPPRALRAVP